MWAVERKEAGPVKTLTEDNSKFPSVGSVFPEKEAGRGEPQTKTKVPVPLKMAAPRANNIIGCTRQGGRNWGAHGAAQSRLLRQVKSEVARWPPLGRVVVLGLKRTGNWKSFWKVRTRNRKGLKGGRCEDAFRGQVNPR